MTNKQKRRLAVVVNAGARSGAGIAEQVLEAVEAAGCSALDFCVQDGDKLHDALTRALAEKPDVVILGGGDGSVTLAAQVLAPAGISLGVLPLGTTNNFARSLGLPLDWEEALDIALRGEPQEVYLGTVNDRIFCNVAAVGVSVSIAQDVTSEAKRAAGRLAYGMIGLQWLSDHRSFRVHIHHAEGKYRFRTHELIVVNGRFHSAHEVAPQAAPEKPHLVAVAFGIGRSRWQLLKTFMLFLLGRHRESPSMFEQTLSSFKLETVPALDIEVDGEVLDRTPAIFDISPYTLKILK